MPKRPAPPARPIWRCLPSSATALTLKRSIGWRSRASRPSELTTSTSFHSSTSDTSTRTMRGSAARAAVSARRSSSTFSVAGMLQRRPRDRVEVGQHDRRDRDRPGGAAARRDLRRRARRLEHALVGQLLGVGVAGGVAAQDAHAQAQRDAAPDGLHAPFLEDVVGARAVLEVEIGVVAARAQRRRQQALGDRGVDRVERRGQRLAHDDDPLGAPRDRRRTRRRWPRAAWRISSSPPPSHSRPTAPNATISSRFTAARFSASLAAIAA